jgi:hypothetical protein
VCDYQFIGTRNGVIEMLIISREQTESRTTSIIQLEDNEVYNQDALLNACLHPSIPRHSSCVGNIRGYNERYEVSIKTGWEPQDDIFAEMVKEYGKA